MLRINIRFRWKVQAGEKRSEGEEKRRGNESKGREESAWKPVRWDHWSESSPTISLFQLLPFFSSTVSCWTSRNEWRCRWREKGRITRKKEKEDCCREKRDKKTNVASFPPEEKEENEWIERERTRMTWIRLSISLRGSFSVFLYYCISHVSVFEGQNSVSETGCTGRLGLFLRWCFSASIFRCFFLLLPLFFSYRFLPRLLCCFSCYSFLVEKGRKKTTSCIAIYLPNYDPPSFIEVFLLLQSIVRMEYSMRETGSGSWTQRRERRDRETKGISPSFCLPFPGFLNIILMKEKVMSNSWYERDMSKVISP